MEALRALRNASEDERTTLLRRAANLIAEERIHFTRDDGTPDWTGRTHAYREWLRTTYEDAGYSREETHSLQSTLRYHVGTAVRKIIPESAREELGLIPESPRERSRESQRAIRKIQDEVGSSLLTLAAVNLVLQRIDTETLSDLPERERDIAIVTLSDVQRRARDLRDALEGWTPDR